MTDPLLVKAISTENQQVAQLFRSGDYRTAKIHAEEAVKLAREAFADLEVLFLSCRLF